METLLNKGEPREERWILHSFVSSLYLMVLKDECLVVWREESILIELKW